MSGRPEPLPCDVRPLAREVPVSEQDVALIRAVVAPQQLDLAGKLARAVALASAVSLPFSVGVALTLDRRLGLELVALTLCVGAVEALAYLAARRGRYREWMSWALTALEVSTPAAIQVLDASRVGLAYAATSAPVMLYAIVVAVSAMRLKPRLCLLAGVLGALESSAVFFVLRSGMDPALVSSLPSLTVQNQVQRSAYVVLAGACGYWLCASLLRMVGHTVGAVHRELRVRRVLGTQVSRQVAEVLLSQARAVGDQRVITVLFSDVRSFTAFSERRDAAEVMAFLNGYFEAMCAVVDRHGGTVNKFIGDGLLALWNAPVDQPDHARRAAAAALEMVGEVARLREAWRLPELDIGVGVHTGEAVVGLLGSKDRCEYTAIGDAVNLASRIEGLNKEHGTRVLVSDATRALLGEGARLREVGACRVKGRDAAVTVHELVALQG